MKYLFLAIIIMACYPAFSQNVSINNDGLPPIDSKSMLEIKKAIFSKLSIRSTGFNDTTQLELGNLTSSSIGTRLRMTLNREEGILFSSSSDVTSRINDSIFSMKFTGNRVYFGMNIKTPTALLHLHDYSSPLSGLRITNNATGVTGTQGLSLSINGLTASLVNTESGNLNFGTNNFVWGGFNSAGNLGLGTTNASERLHVSGNISMTSPKGIILDGQDRPFITRGFDAFTSGNYNGLGRWGLFMETSTLTLGIPDEPGKRFAFAKYGENSVPQNVLTVTTDGAVNKPATGNANLLPIAYGTVNGATGAILNGTGNFSIIKYGTGSYGVSISGESYSNAGYSSQVSVCSDGLSTVIRSYPSSSAGILIVTIVTLNGTDLTDRVFCFTVYKPG